MKNILNKNNGITMIALVITVIILLILAIVAIATLRGDSLFEKAEFAKAKYEEAEVNEKEQIDALSDEIDARTGNGGSGVTLTQEEYQRFKKMGRTLLWEGIGNTKQKYLFKEPTMDISDYEYILIEFDQSAQNYLASNWLVTSDITKDKGYDVILWGYSTRYTGLHFTDNGFVIDIISGDGGYYAYPRYIYGINF